MNNLDFLKHYKNLYRSKFNWGIFWSVLSVLFVMLLPQITQLFIDSIYDFSNADSSKSILWLSLAGWLNTFSSGYVVLILSIIFIIAALLKNVFSYKSAANFFTIGSEACGDLRRDFFKKLAFLDTRESLNESYFNLTADVNDFYYVFNRIFPLILSSSLMVIFALLFTFFINVTVALCLLCFVPSIVGLGFLKLKTSNATSLFLEARNKRSQMVNVAEDLVLNIKEIKSFGLEERAIEKYERYNDQHSKITRNYNKNIYKISLLINIIKAVAIGVIVFMAGSATFNGELSIGYFVLLIAYLFYVVNGTTDFVEGCIDLKVSLIGVARLNNFLAQDCLTMQGKQIAEKQSMVKLQNVDLSLNGRKLFKNLTMRFSYGKKYGVVIHQGEGKTAFVRMLLRFVPINGGKIYVNSHNVENLTIDSYRELFSYVSQEPYIFQDSIKNNIIMFDDEDSEKLNKVISICGLEKLILKYTNGTEHVLNQNASELSSQEKQKINIARALYKNADILLLDSPFNKFDKTTTKKILKNIVEFYKNKTIVYLSDTTNYMFFCDKIIDVENCKRTPRKLRRNKNG